MSPHVKLVLKQKVIKSQKTQTHEHACSHEILILLSGSKQYE